MSFTPLAALGGGALIGLSASVLLVLNGRVAGVSGILGGLARPRSAETRWKIAFLAGLVAGGLALAWWSPSSLAPADPGAAAGFRVVVAGLLVGFGTQLAGGCTSGHGVCGVARLARRSLVAVPTFMAAGMIATFVLRHVVSRAG